tara:strand:+ start:713 stop:934 length:222 start_codon:yes stop_codon:yes gene_type:complete
MKTEYEVSFWVDSVSSNVVGWCEEAGVGALGESVDEVTDMLRLNIINTLTEYGSMGDPNVVNDIIEIGDRDDS